MIIIDFHVVTFILFYIIVLLLTYLIYKLKKNNTNNFSVIAIFAFYLLCVFKLTILPIIIIKSSYIMENLPDVTFTQFVPFKTFMNLRYFDVRSMQVLYNVIMLLPLPIFIELISKKKHTSVNLVLIGFCTSLFIECIQLLIDILTKYPCKVCDIDDLITNTLGVFLGVLIIKYARKSTRLNLFVNNNIKKVSNNI